MSQLGQSVRRHLMILPGWGETFTGGMFPEVAPPDVQGPYLVYTSTNTERLHGLNGGVMARVETLSIVLVASTRAKAEDAMNWVSMALRPGTWAGTSDPKVFWWRIEDQTDVSEVLIEGSDDSVRLLSFSVIGAVSINH